MSKSNIVENVKHPDVRFNDEFGEWKTWKIGDILTEKNRSIQLEDDKDYQLVTVKRRNEGVVSRGLLKGKDILVKNYFEVEEGDYIISKRQVVHGANGIVPKSLHKAVVSNEYLVVTSNDFISTEFWALFSHLPEMYKMFFLSSYGVDIEKLVFDVKDWKKRKITIPELSEQKRITKFFNDLNHLIFFRQKKLNKLVKLKTALLDQMIPKEGLEVPEIRFKGFIDKWAEHEVGLLFTVTRGNTLSATETRKFQTEIMQYPVYSSQTKNNGLMGYYKEYLFENAITWTTDGANAGTVNYREGKFYSTNVNGVLLSNIYANKAIAEILNKVAWKHVSHVGNPKLMNNVMSQIKIFISKSPDELKKISLLFNNIDKLIVLQQEELKMHENIKNAFLKKMTNATI